MNLFPHQTRLTLPAYGALALFCLALFLPGFFTLPPIDRDETRFAQASKQMLQSGDLVDIRFQDKARHKKPAGIYWLQSGAVKIWQSISGDSRDNVIWPYRLPSLLGALFAVLFTAAIGTKLFNAETGFAAGVLLASCLLLNIEARLAKTDAALLATILACQFVLAKAFMQEKALKTKDFFIFWLALASGVLIKGPIVLLGPAGTVLVLKLFKENISFIKKLKPLIGIGLTLLVTAPWYILIALKSNGAFFEESAGRDLLAKIWQGQNWGGALPGLYTIVMPATFWPASLPFMLALPYLWASRHDKAIRFCMAWALPIWLVFECTFTKLPHYVLPAYPALALMAAAWIYSGVRDSGARWWRVFACVVFTGVSLGLGVLTAILPIALEGTLFYFALFAGTLAFGAGLAVVLLFQKQQIQQGIALLPLAGFAMMMGLLGFMLPNLNHAFMSVQIMQNLPELSAECSVPTLITAGYNEESLVFLAGAQTKILNDAENLPPYLKADPCMIAVVEDDQKQRFTLATKSAGIVMEHTATVEGFNYGNGHKSKLGIYKSP